MHYIIIIDPTEDKRIVKVIYKETTFNYVQVGNKGSYKDIIQVTPNEIYDMKLEVLQNDLEQASEKVEEIIINGINIGECNPPGSDTDCTFYDCTSSLGIKEVSSQSGTIPVQLKYIGNEHDCDCNKVTWKCQPQKNEAGQTHVVAAARITLSPQNKAKCMLQEIFEILI